MPIMASYSLPALPGIDVATSSVIYGPTNGQKAILKRSVGKSDRAKNKVQKKKVAMQPVTKSVAVKKAVNGYIIFRSTMSTLFPNFTQALRSRWVRMMWEREVNKTSYSLIGRAWTFVRDNTNYRDLPHFVTGATAICQVTTPQNFLQAYNLALIALADGSVELLQTAPVLPGSIPPARDLSDFQLLNELLNNGLPVDQPMQLGKQMAEHFMHVMTVNTKPKTPIIDEVLSQSGRAVFDFSQQLDYDPIATCAQLLQLDSTDPVFDMGVNVVDCEDITTFDPSSILAVGPQTHRRHQWDTTTAHYAQPNCGAIDITHVEDHPKTYDVHHPEMFHNISGQITQRDFVAAIPEKNQGQYDVDDFNIDDFFMPTAFDEQFPGFDLE